MDKKETNNEGLDNNEDSNSNQNPEELTIEVEEEDNVQEVEVSENENNKEDVIEKDINKKVKKRNNPFKNILFIVLIIVLTIVLLVLFMKVFSSDNNETKELSVSEEKFEEGEDVSIEKAKELVKQANKDLEEIKIPTQEPSTSLPKVPKEEINTENNSPNEYKNSTLDISFTYPKEWVQILSFESKETPDNINNVVMVGYPTDSQKIDNMRISIEGTKTSITSKKYFEETENLMDNVFSEFQLVSKEERTVSGREAPSRTYLWVPEDEFDKSPHEQEWKRIKQLQLYIAGKEQVFVVTFTASEEEFDENHEKYLEILSTLNLGK